MKKHRLIAPVLSASLVAVNASVALADNIVPQGADAPTHKTFLQVLSETAPLIVICYAVFYFMVIRPQDRKAKAQKTLLESLKKGESVITSSGIVGRIAGTEGEFVTLEIAPNVRIKIETAHVVRREKEESKAAA
jgi:preprotein translocase subunit YajC